MASAGMPERDGAPSTSSSPPSGRRDPASTSNSSSWPCPSRATTPEDLAGTEFEGRRPQLACRRAGFARDRGLGVGGGTRGGRTRRGRRRGSQVPGLSPSISATIRSSDPAVTSTTPTVSPSRSTVARSQTAAISMSRCEMKMTERAVARWRPTTSRTRSVRSAGRAAVISSSSRTSGSIASARARSMTRSVASGRSRAVSREVEVGRCRARRASAGRARPASGQAQVRPDVEVRDERRLLVDRDDAAAPRLARVSGPRSGSPRTRIVPSSGWTAPVRILTSVLLPAPLAPISAWTSPGRTDSDAIARRRPRRSASRRRSPRAAGRVMSVTMVVGQGSGRGRRRRPPIRRGTGGRGGLLARALAGDELGPGVRGPVLDREPEGPQLREVGIGAAVSEALPASVVLSHSSGVTWDRAVGRLLAVEELQGQRDAGAADGRRVGHRRADEALLVQELRDEARVVRADDRHERMVGGLERVDDRRCRCRRSRCRRTGTPLVMMSLICWRPWPDPTW